MIASPDRRLTTVAELSRLPDTLPSGFPVKYELHHGALKTFPPEGLDHSTTQSALGCALAMAGKDRRLGRCTLTVAIILERNPDHVLVPDATFILAASLPPKVSEEDYLLTMPDIVVEVRGLNDTLAFLEAKVAYYLLAGVRVVMVTDFDTLSVYVHRVGRPPQVFGPRDTLTVPDVLPNFAVTVRSLFAE